MTKIKTVKQLNNIKDNSLWSDDVIALERGIRAVKINKSADEEFWKGIVIATIVMLIFHFLWL